MADPRFVLKTAAVIILSIGLASAVRAAITSPTTSGSSPCCAVQELPVTPGETVADDPQADITAFCGG